ncbi:FAD-dependent oxidoreductase [Congregibacter litoralis]|uniref:Pyruvate/2-oxoglutarate dehydrogenase complex, dihydrolipoamide dehydrogenase (E3) component n=1 Tax=Congregibacter litoralis KT71 TaxID=314285 RepID=A4A9G4_9GAMM|nr:FAD-dependent oxidoreductase [Congregibacter litoralis]EAQ97131.1 Pyruvate/2-oxoglutarate dehydrogenase complex, dihydrolipoamide dehydrogenase (E3) component [Congregibacter litoralis KT71]
MAAGKSVKIGILALVLGGFFAFWYFDVQSLLSFEALRGRSEDLEALRDANPLMIATVFFALYVAVTGLSLPGAAIMTLAGGAIFGFWTALLLVSFASSLGATLAFLVSRLLLRDWVQTRFRRQLKALNTGFSRDGAFYLFSLRLVPVFPFFVINLISGLLPISTLRFYWVSQLGMLPATAVYINAGTQLGQLESPAGILSPELLGSFVLLAVFPFIARALLNRIKARRQLARFTKPKKFDTNLVVIGAGSAGLVSSLIAATLKAKVTLIERHKMGGDCLNTGCVPSKAILRSAHVAEEMRRAPEFGLAPVEVSVNFPAVMERVQAKIAAIEPHDSVERFTSLGVDCVAGDAKIVSPWEVEVNGERISSRHIVIASGARARVPDITGLEDLDYLTSDTLWDIRELPRRFMVLGAGPIGCELAQAMASLGSEVTLVTHASRIMPREDEDASSLVHARLEKKGVKILTNCEPQSFARTESCQTAQCLQNGEALALEFDRLLLAVGRTPNIEGMGLEELGIGTTDRGTIEVDDYLQTVIPTIFACGDIVGPYQFTHVASHQAWFATVNALLGHLKRFRVDYSVIPWATFTSPEVARVGLSEDEAKAQDVDYEVTRYGIDDLDRAIADSEDEGFVKVLTEPGRDRILGATIVSAHAGDLIPEFVLAMKHGLGLNKILSTIHIYPTMGEANRFLAGEWKKARKPEKVLAWLERYQTWRRG